MTTLTAAGGPNSLARRPGHLIEMYVQYCHTGAMAMFEEDLMTWLAQERFAERGRAQPPLEPDEPTEKQEILQEISKVTKCQIEVSKKANCVPSPKISIERLREEFKFEPKSFIDKIGELVCNYSTKLKLE